MKMAASIELIWQLAAQECIAGMFKEVMPEHFWMALMKFAELPVEEVEKIAPGAEVARELAGEVTVVRDELEARGIDSTRVRRDLRATLGKGGGHFDGGRMHRSEAARDLFDAAAKLADDAGSETLGSNHLLEALLASPTDAMAKVLGDVVGPRVAKPSKTPLLNECGHDLTQMAADGKLEKVSGRQAECRALLHALGQKDRKSVLLICDSDDAVRSVVTAAAAAIAGKDCSREVKGRRIVDVTSLENAYDLAGLRDLDQFVSEVRSRMEKLLAEAAAAKDVILFGSTIDAKSDDERMSEWGELVKTALERGSVQCVCRVAQSAYHKWVQKDPRWGRLAQAMWIHDDKEREVPSEL